MVVERSEEERWFGEETVLYRPLIARDRQYASFGQGSAPHTWTASALTRYSKDPMQISRRSGVPRSRPAFPISRQLLRLAIEKGEIT